MKIIIQDLLVCLSSKIVLNKINLTIDNGEQWAIIGPSGSGKTTLAKALTKSIFFRGRIELTHEQKATDALNIILIEQQHRFKNKSNVANFYYQQRFNSADAEETITTHEEINQVSDNHPDKSKWIRFFNIHHILDKPIIQLSNGENKRLQLVKAMLKNPDLLILDNPFIGLDTTGRDALSKGLQEISNNGVKLILIASENDIPSFFTHIALLQKGIIIQNGPSTEIKKEITQVEDIQLDIELLNTCYKPTTETFESAVKMVNVNIRYNQTQILSNINWQVKRGEKWNLRGPNGSGKSTLLSLITADNPQAYATEIYLFDKRKGTGESIWDIKKKIGYLSPEIHLFFNQGETAFQTVASGLYDTIGLFRKPDAEKINIVLNWMKLLKIDQFADKRLNQLSLGEQRLVMLARALVKSPALLILDEPCQGLDQQQTNFIKNLIDHFCKIKETTLIYVSHYEEDIPSSVKYSLSLNAGNATILPITSQ
jgi:molybdate transport system ATP-binding protein